MSKFNKVFLALNISLVLPAFALQAQQVQHTQETKAVKQIHTDQTVVPNTIINQVSPSTYTAEQGALIYRTTVLPNGNLQISYPEVIPTVGLPVRTRTVELEKVKDVYKVPDNLDLHFVPYDTITTRIYTASPLNIDDEASRLASERKAFAYQVKSITASNSGNNADVEILLFAKNAPLRYIDGTFYLVNNRSIIELTSASANNLKASGEFELQGAFDADYQIANSAAVKALQYDANAFYIYSVKQNDQGTMKNIFVKYYK
ncbi:MAG: DUF1471 domain-containing protein [Candidatus Schmidhempelia sp.]|nr:DUF1471 domain-containing protein [Candidatus Schmidhempelia sp.]